MHAPRSAARSRALLLLLSYAGFISLGIPDTVLGAAWPAMRSELQLPLSGAGVIVMVAMAGNVLSSSLSGHLVGRVTPGTVLTVSTGLAGGALWLFAHAHGWREVLVAAVIAGLGGGAVDSVLNRFVAQNYAVRHMTWLHGSWGIGATLGPLAVASALQAGHAYRVAYLGLATVELSLAVAFLGARRGFSGQHAADTQGARSRPPSLGAASIASIACFLIYCGLESGAGLWTASVLIDAYGASEALAGTIVGGYWGMLMFGRFLIGLLAERIGTRRLLGVCAVTAIAGMLALCLPVGLGLGAAAVGITGLALAPIYPLLMHETPRRFGEDAARYLVGYQVAAGGIGVALIPWLLGLAAQRASLAVVPVGLCALAVVLLVAIQIRERPAT